MIKKNNNKVNVKVKVLCKILMLLYRLPISKIIGLSPEYVRLYDHLDDFQPDAGGVGVDIDGGDGDFLLYDPFHFHHQLHHLHPMMNQVVHRTYQLAS